MIETKIGGFSLVDKPGSAPVTGEGHVIFYADVDFVPSEPGRSARTSEGTYRAASTTSVTWPGLGAGRHALFAQLVNHDDTPLNPPVIDRAVITISDSAPMPSPILSPSAPSSAAPSPSVGATATASQAGSG